MINTRSPISPERQQEFDRLAQLDPRIQDLQNEAASITDDGTSESFCANEIFYGYKSGNGLKHRLSRLVGNSADPTAPPDLKTSEAYDVVYEVIYKALPDCRNCGCA